MLGIVAACAPTPDHDYPHFEAIVEALEAHETEYAGFADTLRQDVNFNAVSCEDNFFEGLRPTEDLEDYLSDDESAAYKGYCNTLGKVSAFETHRGTSFRMYVIEQDQRVISSYLERRESGALLYAACTNFDEARGLCDVPVDAEWSVTYRWQPADE